MFRARGCRRLECPHRGSERYLFLFNSLAKPVSCNAHQCDDNLRACAAACACQRPLVHANATQCMLVTQTVAAQAFTKRVRAAVW